MSKLRFLMRRKKVFSDGRQTPIDKNDRSRVMFLADVARKKGIITRTAIDVLRALLFTFANLNDGRCFPSEKRIGEAAGCHERTVSRVKADLEAAGFITWVNRVVRVRERVPGLPGIWAAAWRVKRTSNAYDFPLIAKKHQQSFNNRQFDLGTTTEITFLKGIPALDPEDPLDRALLSFGKAAGFLKAA